MYINSMKETGKPIYLTKSTDGLGMIAYELERILDDEDRKDLPGKHTKELKAIRAAINNANGDERRINHLFKTPKQHIELKNGAFKLFLEKPITIICGSTSNTQQPTLVGHPQKRMPLLSSTSTILTRKEDLCISF